VVSASIPTRSWTSKITESIETKVYFKSGLSKETGHYILYVIRTCEFVELDMSNLSVFVITQKRGLTCDFIGELICEFVGVRKIRKMFF